MKKTGDKGELIAINYLKNKGYEILETNFKYSTIGEIDIIAKLDKKYIFIEVKYRNNTVYGEGVESITKTKLNKILKTINYYCLIKKVNIELAQFDVISILKETSSYKLTHYKNEGFY